MSTVIRFSKLVAKIVRSLKRILPYHHEYDDLFQMGMLTIATLSNSHTVDEMESYEFCLARRIRFGILDQIRQLDHSRTTNGKSNTPPIFVSIKCIDYLIQRTPVQLNGLVSNEQYSKINTAIKYLPERLKFVITSYYFGGLKLREIGNKLGITEGRTSQLLTKGIKEIRKAMV